MKKKLLSLIFLCSMLVGIIAFALPASASTDNAVIINDSDIPLRLWYDEEALKDGENSPAASTTGQNEDIGWAQWSLPIGNGYFGANVFGRTETERIQITEKTLMNPTSVKDSSGTYHTVGGLNSFSETYIDFNHTNSAVTDYTRYLDLKTAISGVEYKYNGVTYTREYFTSYPDKALVIRLDADTVGALSFTLRPTIPYEQSYGAFEGDGVIKTGTVTSSVNGGVGYVELAGEMKYYGIDFLGMYKVYTDGGNVTASTTQHTYEDKDGTTKTDTDGTIVVDGAKSAYIVVTLGTDYELSSEIFTSADTNKPTKTTTIEDTRAKVGAYMSAIEAKMSGKSYEEAYKMLRDAHIADHSGLFGRVSIDLGCKESDFAITTDELLTRYKNGTASTYLETLIFQYGRYLLVASSRTGALPANLQGAWNTYNTPPWAAAYTHNMNVEMNYWPAFSTNLAETFQSYIDYNAAYMEQAEKYADSIISTNNPDAYDKDGGNGWVLGNHIYPYRYTSSESAGNLGFMTQVFWEYYEYTKDPVVLEQVYSVLIGAAKYITKCVELDEDGNYLVQNCDSPEMFVNGVWYYTDGTTYAQTFAYLNNYHALLAAEELGIDLSDSALLSTEEYSIFKTILEQIDKYDPIKVGLSGQIKEFREETYYNSVGDDPKHRHVSQLMALFPGDIINASTPAWLDAAEVSLSNRGLGSMGWARAHRMALWARLKNGDEAYNMLGAIIKDRTGYNLWNQGPPYQIDGSFGATAAIAEMLLQSHNGYIEPLAALSSSWSTGSYTGLVARGNFEVSAVWENGLAKTFNIKSNAGGTASVYYPSITTAYVVDSDGNRVNYTVSGQDLISFETEAGKTYIIYGFKALNTPDAPTGFNCTEGSAGALNFTWNASAGASSYNVYVAVEDAATYTLIGSTASTSFSYTPDSSVSGLRTTYAVTAVGERESDRALTYTAETIVTEYGEIPSSSAADATFAIFAKKSGSSTYKFIETGSQFVDEGLDKARQYLKSGSGTYQGGTVVVYLLSDYTCKGTSSGAGWNAAFQINGTLVVDLGGHKLTSTAPRLVGVEVKSDALGYDKTTNIEFKNGTLCTSKPIVELFGGGGLYTGTKACNIKFTGIDFTPYGTISEFTMIKARGSFSSTQKATFGVTFDSCNLNYASLSKLTVIDDSCAVGSVTTAVEFKGGNIYAQSFDTLKIINGAGKEDTSLFTRGSNNARTEFTVKYTSTAPTVTFNTDDGVKHLASASIDNATEESKRTTTYRLTSFKTPYGYVPENHKDKAFSLFYNDLHIASYGVYLNAEKKIQELTYPNAKGIYQGETLTLYMINDYEHTDTPYANFAQIDGTFVLDLGGKTLTMKSNHLFDVVGKAVNNTVLQTTNVVVKNGTILTNDKPIMQISSKGTSGNFGYNGVKPFSFTYENVTFDKMASASAYTPLISIGQFDETGLKNIYISAVFTNCSFTDFDSTIFDFSVSNYIDADIVINGGSITSNKLSETSIIKVSDANDTLTFGKNADGSYTKLILPKGASTPTIKFNGDTLVFSKISESSDSVTYILRDKNAAKLDYVPKMSITLESNLVVNIYVPKENLVAFNLDGKEYGDLSLVEAKLVTVDGKDYYRMQIKLPANEAAREITLKAVITLDDTNASGTFTFSVLKYCAKVLASSSADQIEKTLAKDILAYIKSAYVYFGSDMTDINADAIDDLLGNYIHTFEKASGESNTSAGLHSAQFILLENPVIRFYLSYGKTKDDYTFKQDGKTLKYSSYGSEIIDGVTYNYVDISLYAYQLIGEITYTDGTYNGSYHINSYYDFITTDTEHKENANLIDVVEKLYNYCKSAAAYRNYVYSPCNHSYASTVKAESTAFTKGLIEYKCSSCGNTYEESIPTALKVLAVGNSFSVDAMQHLYLVAKDAGIENVVLGTLYKGGCSLDMHMEYMSGNLANYETFYISSDTSKELVAHSKNVTAKYAITYEDWDYIVIQQVSNYTGMASKYGNLQGVIDYINANKTSDAEILWHMTWAYQQDTTNSGFANYGKDQMTMYNSIVSVVNDLILTNSDISGVIPAGTAIQNLRTSYLGDTITRDGYHLSYGIGRYTAALTWLAYLTGCDVDTITAIPSSYPEIAEHLDIIKASVKCTMENPYSVTEITKTITVNYVDEDGNTLAPSKTVTLLKGEETKFLTPAATGYYTRDVYLTLSYENDTTVNVTYKKIPTNASEEKVDELMTDIVAWGDSITAGAGKNDLTSANTYGIDLEALGSSAVGESYVTVLRNLIRSRIYSGISVRGCGVGGESTATIASRADTETYYLYLDGTVTISSSAVIIPLTHYSSGGRVGILRQGGGDEINPVTIIGKDMNGNEISVTGTLTLSLTADAPAGTDIRTCDAKYLQYTFTRDDGKTDTLVFASGARVVTKASYIYDGRTCIIFMGENGGYSNISELIKQQEEILAACGNPEFYLIISTTSGSYESRTEIRNALSARWGDRYINMGDELNSSEESYKLAGYSDEAIASVAGNIVAGTVSTLLIKDSCHPNAVGYAVIGNIIFERLFDLGAFEALFDYYDSLNS